jgi:hypothetical protein
VREVGILQPDAGPAQPHVHTVEKTNPATRQPRSADLKL